MTPWLDDGDVRLYHGDNLDVLRQLPDRSVHMCATSPPFYGLRDYGTGLWDGGDPECDHTPPTQPGRSFASGSGHVSESNNQNWSKRDPSTFHQTCGKCGARRVDQQIGLEDTPDQWVERLVAVFREVRRVLRDDGTLWVEIGDSYNGSGGYAGPDAPINKRRAEGDGWGKMNPASTSALEAKRGVNTPTCKPKDLLGQPWLLAFALRADGWYLRSEIIWARPNPMPESVTDRPTKSHSTVFLLSKQPRYFYDADAIREPNDPKWLANWERNGHRTPSGKHQAEAVRNDGDRHNAGVGYNPAGANARSVWTIPTQPTPFAHFATWPEALVRRMILAGTSERGCCPDCGAPWTRDVERIDQGHDGSRYGERVVAANVADGGTARSTLGSSGGKLTGKTATLGWSPSCTHDTQPVPCTVLDPFAGSATTCLVARNHGRHSIGIELNADYLTIAAKRLQQLSLLNT